ncbi:MAG: hypothetical protein Q9170_005346 [Blastenia crenularia]
MNTGLAILLGSLLLCVTAIALFAWSIYEQRKIHQNQHRSAEEGEIQNPIHEEVPRRPQEPGPYSRESLHVDPAAIPSRSNMAVVGYGGRSDGVENRVHDWVFRNNGIASPENNVDNGLSREYPNRRQGSYTRERPVRTQHAPRDEQNGGQRSNGRDAAARSRLRNYDVNGYPGPGPRIDQAM